MTLTRERLLEVLYYDPLTGDFRWTKNIRKRFALKPAGGVNHEGYRFICVDYIKYAAHRLAWLYVHGQWPSESLDHANRNRSDNRISNLRLANRSQQRANSAIIKRNKTGYRGVTLVGPNQWRARINIKGKKVAIGTFRTPEQAHAAYLTHYLPRAGRFVGELRRSSDTEPGTP